MLGLTLTLSLQVISPVRPLAGQPAGEGGFEDSVGLLFLVAIVLPSVLLLLLVAVLLGLLLRSCRHPPSPAAQDGSDVVGTKYQRGDRLDDYNLHVDMERGEIVDRTPGHTPEPPSHRHSLAKTPLPSLQSDAEDDTLNSKRRMIDRWLKDKHADESGPDSESVAKSDTYLYARPREKRARRLEASTADSYKNEYLQALKMSETELTQEELTGHVTEKRCGRSYALQERRSSVPEEEEEDGGKSAQSPRLQQGDRPPPQAKPRSFVGKLRESLRKKRQRSNAAPPADCNTQSTVMSVLGDSSHTLSDRSTTSRETSVERERRESVPAHHTDASDEFTIAMMPGASSTRSSRERLYSAHHVSKAADSRSRHAPKRDPRADPTSKKSLQFPKDSTSSPGEEEEDPDLTTRKSRPLQISKSPATKDDEPTVRADSTPPPRLGYSDTLTTRPSKDEDLVPILRAIQTQTSLTSSSDVSREEEVEVKSVAVGPSGVNRKTQTTAPRDRGRDKHGRKAVQPERGPVRSGRHPLLSSMSSSDSRGSVATMEEEVMEEEFLPERIEPFAKMSQVGHGAGDKDGGTIPVKFRRNLFEEGPLLPEAAEVSAVNVQKQPLFYKPAHHMRGQPRVAYSAMDPEQRQQTEMLDTMRARQQLLLRQQQEVTAFAQRQQLEQQAQRLVNSACLLATPPHPPTTPAAPTAWAPTPTLTTSLMVPGGAPLGFGGGAAAPGAPGGFPAMNQEELMQAVRKELKRMQQE